MKVFFVSSHLFRNMDPNIYEALSGVTILESSDDDTDLFTSTNQLVKVIITGHDHNCPLGIECLHEPVQGVGFKIFDVETESLKEHLAKCDVILSVNGTDVGNCSFEEFASLMVTARQTEQIELIIQKG